MWPLAKNFAHYHFCKRLVARRIGRSIAGVGEPKALLVDFIPPSDAEAFLNAAEPVLKVAVVVVAVVLATVAGEAKILAADSVVVPLKEKPLPGVSFDFALFPKRFADKPPLPKENALFCDCKLLADKDANEAFSVLGLETNVLLDVLLPKANGVVTVGLSALEPNIGSTDWLFAMPKGEDVWFTAVEPKDGISSLLANDKLLGEPKVAWF
uniref:Uncharacterized protein n=1 Tax=Glossina brevipalpis TaxID=37001 RepID=A0A1A9WDF5_9MUSC